MADDRLLLSELLFLLATGWGPVLLVCGALHYRFLTSARASRIRKFAVLSGAVLLQCVLALLVWSSPLSTSFFMPEPRFLPGILPFAMLPFQAILPGAALVTMSVWKWAKRRGT